MDTVEKKLVIEGYCAIRRAVRGYNERFFDIDTLSSTKGAAIDKAEQKDRTAENPNYARDYPVQYIAYVRMKEK